MASQFLFTLTSIVFLLFSLSYIYCTCDAHYSPRTEKLPSPLHFQKNLNATLKKGDRASGLAELKQYLKTLGYIEKGYPKPNTHYNNSFDDMLELAITKYQMFYSLNVTGTFSRETLELLSRPRCAEPDIHTRRSGRADRLSRVSKLYYSYSEGFRQDARVPIEKAMRTWENRTAYKFIFRNKNAGLKISFNSTNHNEDAHHTPFIRPDLPISKATNNRPVIEFNADMVWQTHGETHARLGAYDLETSALHAIGHIFGLSHSSIPNAVMYALLPFGEMKRELSSDDIQAYNALYNEL